MSFRIVEIDGIQCNNRRRIYFLTEVQTTSKNDALSAFNKLKDKDKRYFFASFQSWVDGVINKNRYHGWDQKDHRGEFKENFVFKNNRNGIRFYGRLCKPVSKLPRCECCILIVKIVKKEFEINPSDIKRVNERFNLPAAQEALCKFFSQRGEL